MRIGVDVDGVLADFNTAYIERCISVTGKDLFPPRPFEITTWNHPESYGYTAKEVSKVWDSIKRSLRFWYDLQPYDDAIDAMDCLARRERNGDDLYFITARPGLGVKRQTEDWLRRYMDDAERPTVLISSHKGLCAAALRLDQYIDDKIENVLDTSLHCYTYLMNRPWNRHFSNEKGYTYPIIRVSSVEEMFER